MIIFGVSKGKLRLSSKSNCLILTNCHGGRLAQVFSLSAAFIRKYEIIYRPVHLQQAPSEKEIENCGVFLYQHIDDRWDELASHKMLQRMPAKCISIQLPKLSSHVYWPYFDRPVVKEPAWCIPCEKFPYYEKFILECIDAGLSVDATVGEYLEHDISKVIDLDRKIIENKRYLANSTNCSDINLNHLIFGKLGERSLFASPNHPILWLLIEEANMILEILGFKRIEQEAANDLVKDWEFYLPIHPSIIRYFSLVTPTTDTRYRMHGIERTFEEYIWEYTKFYSHKRTL